MVNKFGANKVRLQRLSNAQYGSIPYQANAARASLIDNQAGTTGENEYGEYFTHAIKESVSNIGDSHTYKELLKHFNHLRILLDQHTIEIKDRLTARVHKKTAERNQLKENLSSKDEEKKKILVGKKEFFTGLFTAYLIIGMLWFCCRSGLSFLDALYQIVIIFTTVGYGVLVDEVWQEQLFLIFYTIVGVSVVFTGMSYALDGFLAGMHNRSNAKFLKQDELVQTDENPRPKWLQAICESEYTPFVAWLAILFLASLFLAHIEDWKYIEAIYFCVVSGSTVGFGDFEPETNGGKWVVVFFLPSFLLMTAYVFSIFFSATLSTFIDHAMEEMQLFEKGMDELLNDDNFTSNLQLMDFDGDNQISEPEFLVQVLINHYQVPTEFIDRIRLKFEKLDVDGSRTLELDDFIKAMNQDNQPD